MSNVSLRKLAVGWAIASSVGTVLPACEGDEESSDATEWKDTGDGTLGGTACYQCTMASCASEAGACKANTECKSYLDCLMACPAKNSHEVDEDCKDTCTEPAGGGAGEAAADALFACVKEVDGQDGDQGAPCEAPCE